MFKRKTAVRSESRIKHANTEQHVEFLNAEPDGICRNVGFQTVELGEEHSVSTDIRNLVHARSVQLHRF